MRWIAAGLLHGGCGGAEEIDPCAVSPRPTLEIGAGTTAFRGFARDGELELVHGRQGGFHVEVALRATGMKANGLVAGFVEATLDGEVRARSAPWLELECDGEGLTSLSNRLIYDDVLDPEELAGRVTFIVAEVTDSRGKVARTEAEALIVDNLVGSDPGE